MTFSPLRKVSVAQDGATLTELPAWQTMTARLDVPIKVTTDKPRTFWGRISRQTVENVTFTRISRADHMVERPLGLISSGVAPRYKLNLQLAGTGFVLQDGREVVLSSGDFALLDTHRPYSTAFDGEFEIMVVEFPQHLLDLQKDRAEQLTAVRMSGNEGAGRLVGPFLTNLANNLDLLCGVAGPQFAQNALDMVGTMFLHLS